jgi:mRNA interferase MazF
VSVTPALGQVYRCDLGYGAKPWLVVSNNARNRVLSDVIAIRLTTTVRELPTWVKQSTADPLTGYANADCIEQLRKHELGDYLGDGSAKARLHRRRMACGKTGQRTSPDLA